MKTILPEEELIIAIQRRSKIGAEALYDMYSGNLFKVVYSIVKQHELAEDVLQLAFLKIWENFDQYNQQKGRLYTWMITITRNLSKDALRTRAYKQSISNIELESVGFDVDKRCYASINIDIFGIKESLKKLKKEHQDILTLIYFKGYTHVEAATELGIPLGTVKTRWNSGLNTLRKNLC